VQDILESKLEKQKRRKGIYGPLIGTTNIIFIDDLNMPTKEQYGAQPPLELIRQWFSQGGWYDRKLLEFKTIVDIQFVASLGEGRPAVSNRLLRNFNIICLPELDDAILGLMVRKIFDWGFASYVDKVKFEIGNLVAISLAIYKAAAKKFLPLPRKSHYLFNLRDLMKIVNSML
jgi:dynein heavy chain